MRLCASSTVRNTTFTCTIDSAAGWCREIHQKVSAHVYANAPYLAEQFVRFCDADEDIDAIIAACSSALRDIADKLYRDQTAGAKEQYMDMVWYAMTRQARVQVTSVNVYVRPGRCFDVSVALQNPMGGSPSILRIEGGYK